MSLNLLPNGKPSPRFKVTAIGRLCSEVKTVELQEWWYDGKKVESIEESADKRFYDLFDKHPFKILEIVPVKRRLCFCHRYKWGHDKRRKKLFQAKKKGLVQIVETYTNGWLFELTEDFKKKI